MTRAFAVTLLMLALSGAAHGFGLGLGNRFGKLGASSGAGTITPPVTGALLINTGSAFLINTGSKLLIQ
jgi:hypothetical protein